ncbi:hypothetical protein BGZ76_000120 [Entomortierella beljakovae]|nr:hypothetical protein BGZ76_000120 [Entomortierella beljakovae]
MPNYHTPSTFHTVNPSKPKILIVGAGIGGLTLAILLEIAGIDYEIYDRSSTLTTHKSPLALAPNVLPLFEQLGLLPELQSKWKHVKKGSVYKETKDGSDLEHAATLDFSDIEALSGYPSVIMSRPDLYAILLSRVPTEKIHLGKRVLSISQDESRGIIIRTSDGMSHEGDVLVGSDGANSGVRQSLYKQLSTEGKLPPIDYLEETKVCHVSIIGTTEPMDPSLLPPAKDNYARCDAVIGHKKVQTWRYFELPQNRLCWRVDAQIHPKSYAKSESFRNTGWGIESSGYIEDDWYNFKVPIDGESNRLTLGDLFRSTRQEDITKVIFEEKLYSTWYHCRTVLIGDGAINAILDALKLANELYEIADNFTAQNVQNAFKEYYNDRYSQANADLQASQKASKLFAGQSWSDNMLRMAVFNFMPTSLVRILYIKSFANRPQANFLPKIQYRGSGRVDSQKESTRYSMDKALTI